MLLREADRRLRLVSQLAAYFDDRRDPAHRARKRRAGRQRVFGLALGYEDLNDHDQLRHDPLLAVAAGKADPTGAGL